MTPSKERVENPRRARTRRSHKQDSLSVVVQSTSITSRHDQHVQCERKLTPCSEDLDALLANLRTFLSRLLGFKAVCFFTFPPFPWRSETRATFLKKKKKHTTRPITSDSSSSPSPLRQHSSAVLSSQVTCTPAFLCPRSQRRPTPRICFYMRVMTRGSAQLCSLGTGSVESRWRPDSSGDIL